MRTKRILLSFVSLLLCAIQGFAYQIQEIKVWSKSMKKPIPVNIITPQSYSTNHTYPTIYLLHGHGDNHKGWSRGEVVGKLADIYNLVVVMPDGGHDS